MTRNKWIVSLLAAALVAGSLAGCGAKTDKAEAYADQSLYDSGVTYETSVEMAAGTMGLSANRATAKSAQTLPENRKWIITMNLSAETDDLDAALEAIDARIQALEGYVEGQNVSGGSSGSGRHRFANLTIRVPADQVDSFVEEIAGLTNVVSSSRNVQDITLTYTDTAGRVTALETEQARLLELMEQAETMSDLLEIEARLTEVRYQLESYASTLRLYDNQVDYATVSLYITEVEKYTPVEEPGFWEKITGGLWDSVVNLGETIVAFVSWLIIDLPYLALIALFAWAVISITKRTIRKRKAKKENNTTK